MTLPSVLVLPQWLDDQRGMPNALVRAALFNVASATTGKRQLLQQRLLHSVDGLAVRYTGAELRQDDQDVFLQILHLARSQELGETVRFTCNSMLKALGWTINKESYARLDTTIAILTATALSVTFSALGKSVTYGGSLVRNYKAFDNDKVMLKRWEVQLEPEILVLFGATTYTRINWEMRLALSPLGKGLYAFYSTHHIPMSYSVIKLHELLGSKTKSIPSFRQKLKIALQTLVDKSFLVSFNVNPKTDVVNVVRQGSQH
tara:strand:- start:4381 stop:5163 length:783 start_codon:yes stop_codon:yes gene_type:complete